MYMETVWSVIWIKSFVLILLLSLCPTTSHHLLKVPFWHFQCVYAKVNKTPHLKQDSHKWGLNEKNKNSAQVKVTLSTRVVTFQCIVCTKRKETNKQINCYHRLLLQSQRCGFKAVILFWMGLLFSSILWQSLKAAISLQSLLFTSLQGNPEAL